jgi:predicted ATP-binding protein involved in virulence
MKIRSLGLKNFRGFQDVQIHFPEDVAVLIGTNGAGKSSVLDAIAILLSEFVRQLLSDKKRTEKLLSDDDVNLNSKTVEISLSVSDTSTAFTWMVSKSQRMELEYSKQLRPHIKQLQSQLANQPRLSLPICVYYPTDRLIRLTSPLFIPKAKPYPFPQYNAFENAFDGSSTTRFGDFFHWFREEENLENQVISREDPAYRSPQLQVIRAAIELFFSQLTQAVFSSLRVSRFKRSDDFSFRPEVDSYLEILKNGHPIKVTQLSDGEKTLLMLVADIARRLAIANPALENSRDGAGIILIDELDSHLHPAWQREVIPALRKTFPNCQWIVTTHSPQVLSNVFPENILILEDWQVVESNPHSYGRDSNSILYEFMGVEKRPSAMKLQLEHLSNLIDAGKTQEAQAQLEALQQDLGTDDPDLIRANTMLEFYSHEAHSEK